ncbi:MAG: hypothetical protein OXE78_02055 [Gammaproteobacteria bacterium]|nr:hypothetical protein [Gammaproteobacteria bacterium]
MKTSSDDLSRTQLKLQIQLWLGLEQDQSSLKLAWLLFVWTVPLPSKDSHLGISTMSPNALASVKLVSITPSGFRSYPDANPWGTSN